MSDAAAGAVAGGAVVNRDPGIVNGDAGKFTVPEDMVAWGKNKVGDNFGKHANENPEFYKLAVAYRDTEKLLGGEKLPLPKDMNDDTAMSQIYDKLGRPKSPNDYKIPVKEGDDPALSNWSKEAFHKAGLSQKQAEKIAGGFNEYIGKIIAESDRQTQEKAAADMIGLTKDWGNDMEGNKIIAGKAWNALSSELGISRDKLDALQEVLGVRDAMRLFEKIGTKIGMREDKFEGGENGQRGGGLSITKAEAQQKKDALLADKSWAKRYKEKDVTAVKQIGDLNAILAG